MKKTEVKEILKYLVIAGGLFAIFAGLFLLLDVYQIEQMGYLHESDILDEMVNKYCVGIYYILVPLCIIISLVINSKLLYAISLLCEEVSVIYEYISLKKFKSYSDFKPLFLLISIVVVLMCILWSLKKISNVWMLGIMLLSQIEGLEHLIKNGRNMPSIVFVGLVFVVIVGLNTLPIFIIKDRRKK